MFWIGPLIQFVCAALLAWAANWVGLGPWRRAATEHWTERARLLWPFRFTGTVNFLLIPLLLDQARRLLFPETATSWISNGVASFLGAVLGCYPTDRQIFPQLGFRAWLHNAVAGWGIQIGMWAALIMAGVLMPKDPGWGMVLVAGGYLAFHFAIQWGLFLKYLRAVRFLHPAERTLQQIVNSVAARMGAKVRATWQMEGPLALAFALPTTRELAFSNCLLQTCVEEEVAAICAHELAHLQEPKVVLAGRLLGSLSFFPLIFLIPSIHHFGVGGIFLCYAGAFLIAIFARKLAHSMERRADQLALSEQANEGVYARALEKIHRANQFPAVYVNRRQTHPHLYDRMLAAGVTPDYPRPAKPKRLTVMGWLYAILFVILLIAVIVRDEAAG